MGKTVAKKILELLQQHGGVMDRISFNKKAIVEIGSDPRTIKRLNQTLRMMKEYGIIHFDSETIKVIQND